MQEKVTMSAVYGGSAVSIIAGLTISEWGVIGGLIIGAIGLVYNIIYKERLIKVAKSKGVRIGEEE